MILDEQRVYREIYEENAGRIYGYIFRKICDSASAEDLKQEVFIALLLKLPDFLSKYPDNNSQIKAWLFGVAGNQIKLYWRNVQRRLDTEVPLEALEDTPDPFDEFSGVEFKLPDWLRPEEKEILSLRASGYSLKEVAGRMGISYAACKQRNARMMRELKAYYKK